MQTIDAKDIYYRQLNEQIRAAVDGGAKELELLNVNGQRYIFNGIKGDDINLTVHGVPGQDMAAFMNGPTVRVIGNAQDGVGNTMDNGRIVIDGMAGDVLGYGMRGGRVLVRGDVGYRVGIHMKAYKDKIPALVIGGKAGDCLGEYMAGGVILLLGMFSKKPYAPVCGRSLGTGMHGGTIYVRGKVPAEQLSFNLSEEPADADDRKIIAELVSDFAAEFDENPQRILDADFYKLKPISHRPYGNMYVAC
jgi:glutamate synthase domain-containing protein 3